LFVAWEWWQKKEARTDLAKRMSAGALLFLAIVVPWIARNYRDFGTLSVSSEAPWALYFDYVPSLYSVDRGLSFPDARTLARAQLKEADPSIDFANRISPSLLAQQALTRIKEEKSGVLKLQVINTVWFFTNDNYAYHLDRFGLVPDRPPLFSPTQLIIQEGVKSVPIIFQYLESVYFIPVIGRLFWVFITLFALLGFIFLFLQKNTSRMLVIFMAGLILYYYTTASPIGLAGEGRLRMPASPMLFLFAAAGVIYAWHYIQTKRRADYSK
ncbi:MAG: hypothetical protein KGH79_03085, partial [Patescibacteria group bacterium]|nr:hypothetical protein [Patescibacteria group bacterium]